MATDMKKCSPTNTDVEKSLKSGRGGAPVKMLIPFGLQCDECGRRTNKGDRVWALKEEAGKDSSLDVEIYRFQVTCPCCRATFSIISDPGRYDYVLEAGATLVPRKF
ncbi:hypothetical protein Pfo_010726 [Paulownia fortunei]|nr:hypothetical protein Pfo_010726 [Paulownia fortunei]